MKISEFVDLLVEVAGRNRILYNDKIIGISTEADLIKIYNAYYFKEHLKRAGFFWDNEQKAWIGTIKELMSIDKEILTRLLESSSIKSLMNLMRAINMVA